ncbi:MAG: type IV toxin-antitoxin system AbiEi family antitoxin [Actinomycetota bacterium]|nr:type IV toxin-antitoxin system AbiEi family antitoxin [Actinomycetota bacterium]
MATVQRIEREAARLLPDLLRDLLDEPDLTLEPPEAAPDRGIDFVAHDNRGRTWAMQVKASSGPGQVVTAARHLAESAPEDAIPLFVVPFMSRSGADAAARERLNWLDLSGNAAIRAENLYVWVDGRPNRYTSRGRRSSPFAPKSARITRTLLLEPARWWLQRDLVDATGLDDGTVSRIVSRLDEELLLERRDRELRPRDPVLLLDAWADHYRFDRHDAVSCHVSGSGIEVARKVAPRLEALDVHHAFTGLPAAWAIDHFARFRLSTVYVEDDPRDVAERLEARQGTRGANLQILGPNDVGVFAGEQKRDGLNCVATVQIYLDLLNLAERADEAARHLRAHHLRWHGASR